MSLDFIARIGNSPTPQRMSTPDLHKNNNDATTAPGVTDDSDAGYSVGSLWFDKTAGKVYGCTDASVGAAAWQDLTGAGGGGGAPTDATYITQTPNGTLSAEQALNALSDGLLKHASGVVAMAIAGTDYPTVAAVAANTSHAISNGTSHTNVVLGDTHRLGDGLDHAAVRRNADVLNGHIVETISITAPESGGTVYATLEAQGGGDLTLMWSDGPATLDCTPAKTVALTAGADTSPTRNYVYVLKSTGLLTASTAGWPGAEYAPIADIIVQSAASVASKEVMKNHAWTDHLTTPDGNGHLADINSWIRAKDATWLSGVAPDLTITVVGGSDTVIFTCTAGMVRQLHKHVFPAFTGTPDIYVHNDFTSAFKILTDLNQLDAYSDGSAIGNGDYFSVVLKGVVSEAEGECKLLLGLPSGGYNLESQAVQDIDGTSDYTIPADYKGCGFLIARIIFRYRSLDSGTFTKIAEEDLRGKDPQTAAGGSAVHTSSFASNVFEIYDGVDPTATLVIDTGAIAPGAERTIIMPDEDVDLGDIASAIHDNVAGEILAIAEKTVPVGTDEVLIEEADGTKKSVKLFNINPAILRVPFRYSTIAAAIAAASIGDIIDIAPGTYTENVDFSVDKLKIRAHGEVTIIDGTTATAVVVSGDDIIIRDLAVRTNTGSANASRGFFITGDGALLENCVILACDLDAFVLVDCFGTRLLHCRTLAHDRYGLLITGGTTYFFVNNCYFAPTPASTNFFLQGDYGTLRGNFVGAGASFGIQLTSSTAETICTSNFANIVISDSGTGNTVANNG